MELYFLASGERSILKSFEEQLSWNKFKYNYMQDGKPASRIVCGNLQPIKLYRYVFPKEALDIVLTDLDLPTNKQYNFFDKNAFALRKLMHAQKIPVPKPLPNHTPLINRDNIAIIGVGIKPDAIRDLNDGLGERELI